MEGLDNAFRIDLSRLERLHGLFPLRDVEEVITTPLIRSSVDR